MGRLLGAEKKQDRWNRRSLVPSAFVVQALDDAALGAVGLPAVATATLKREILSLLAPYGDPALGVPAAVQDQVPRALATAVPTLSTLDRSGCRW